MRTRAQILTGIEQLVDSCTYTAQVDPTRSAATQAAVLEVLLDVRDLLLRRAVPCPRHGRAPGAAVEEDAPCTGTGAGCPRAAAPAAGNEHSPGCAARITWNGGRCICGAGAPERYEAGASNWERGGE